MNRTRQRRFFTPPAIVSGYTSEFKDYWDRVIVAGSDISVSANRTAIDNFIRAEKNTGEWQLSSEIYLLCGSDTFVSSWPKLKYVSNANITFINFVSGDYNRVTGLKGNGSSKYGNLNFNASGVLSIHNSHLSFLGSEYTNSGTRYTIGIYNNSTYFYLHEFTGYLTYQRFSVMASAAQASPSSISWSFASSGFVCASSTSSNLLIGYENGLSVSTNTTNRNLSTIPNGNIYIYVNNDVILASVPRGYSSARLQTGSIGLGFTAANVSNRNTNLVTLTGALT